MNKIKDFAEPIIRPKSSYQEDDCFYRNCPNNKSTLEAIFGIAAIRCCDDENCKEFAIKIAKAWEDL